MSEELRQGTDVAVAIGVVASASDGVTEYTTNLLAADVLIRKHNAAAGAWAARTGTFSATHAPTHTSFGFFRVLLSGSNDTDTPGHLYVGIHKAGQTIAFGKFDVVSAVYYDAKYANTGAGMRGNVITMANDVITAGVIAPDAIGSSELAAGAVTEIAAALPTALSIADAVWDEPTVGHSTQGTYGFEVAGVVWRGKAIAADDDTLQLAAADVFGNATQATLNYFAGRKVVITGGTGATLGQIRRVMSNTASATPTLTVELDWIINPFAPGQITEIDIIR